VRKEVPAYKWSVVCRPNDQGGLGVHDLEVKNIALLGKWLSKVLTKDSTCLANYLKNKVCWFKGDIPSVLKIWRFTLLG
jgi:hypothetical protein